MEKGSFQAVDALLEGMDIIEDHQVPLPNQVPTTQSIVTPSGGHSSALDSLILQNEDLLSRLSVNIRRNASLEDEIQQLLETKEIDKKLIENLKDQIFILRKKDSFISDRHQKTENIQKELSEKIQFLEQKYIEYYTTSEQKIENLIDNLFIKSKENQRLTKYRSKITLISKNLKNQLKTKTKELESLQIHLREVQSQLAEAAEHIRCQTQEANEKVKTLTEQYSIEALKSSERVKNLELESKNLWTQVDELNYTLEENIEFKNEIIELKRQISSLKQTHSNDLSDLQKKYSEAKRDLKQKTVENNTLHHDHQNMIEETDELKAQSAQMTDQVESLQILWSENQNETEKLKKQNQSLQKLNQELSTKLNAQRTEINQLKTQLDQSILGSKDKIKLLIEKQRILQDEQHEFNSLEAQKTSANILSKMETLICEIQTGFTSSDQKDI